jgi:hypothetical protein
MVLLVLLLICDTIDVDVDIDELVLVAMREFLWKQKAAVRCVAECGVSTSW